MSTPHLALSAALTLVLAGCGLVRSAIGDRTEITSGTGPARHIEIEVNDLESGLPCSVIDRPDPETRDVLWHAEFEAGFCRRKAEETRLILEKRGWACRPQRADERRDLATAPAAGPAGTSHLVAAWRCVDGLAPIERLTAGHPPVPSARPVLEVSPSGSFGNAPLRAAVERDLATIGQDVIGDDTSVDTALGDLDRDGIDDAIVVLTRKVQRGAPHRLLMAYVHNGEAYSLVDVWVLKAPGQRDGGSLTLAIEDGAVLLEDCCEDRAGSIILVLDNRKLAYADGR